MLAICSAVSRRLHDRPHDAPGEPPAEERGRGDAGEREHEEPDCAAATSTSSISSRLRAIWMTPPLVPGDSSASGSSVPSIATVWNGGRRADRQVARRPAASARRAMHCVIVAVVGDELRGGGGLQLAGLRAARFPKPGAGTGGAASRARSSFASRVRAHERLVDAVLQLLRRREVRARRGGRADDARDERRGRPRCASGGSWRPST